jgi:hypothetical protein
MKIPYDLHLQLMIGQWLNPPILQLPLWKFPLSTAKLAIFGALQEVITAEYVTTVLKHKITIVCGSTIALVDVTTGTSSHSSQLAHYWAAFYLRLPLLRFLCTEVLRVGLLGSQLTISGCPLLCSSTAYLLRHILQL